GQADDPTLPPRPADEGEPRNRFGFFGQITPYKGLDVVLGALAQMKRKQRRRIVLEVHGANLDKQTDEYRKRVEALRAPLMEEGVVQWVGPYQPHELRNRMAGVDWVVVPSIWWENSPMVIQEAFTCGRPLLVSDIGGMAEKVRDGVDGLHVANANRMSWAHAIRRAAEDEGLWAKLRAGIRRPESHARIAERHLEGVRQATGGAHG